MTMMMMMMSSDEKMTTASSVSSKLKCMDVEIGEGSEEEMDKHHLTRPHQPEPHTSGRIGSRRLGRRTRVAVPSPEGFTAYRKRQEIRITQSAVPVL